MNYSEVHTAAKACKTIQQWGKSGLPKASHDKDNQADKHDEHRSLHPSPNNAVDMSDARQAHAYVEGFRMGQLAAQQQITASKHAQRAPPAEREIRRENPRARSGLHNGSRSPKIEREDRHFRRRSRSPSRVMKRGRRRSLLSSVGKSRRQDR